MANSIRMRAKVSGEGCTVKAFIKHVMETGQRKNAKTGKVIPAHFIKEVTCTHNGNEVISASWGTAVSVNPYLSFDVQGAKAGDRIAISWTDNQGQSDSAETVVQ